MKSAYVMVLYLPNFSSFHFRSLGLHLIPQDCIDRVCEQDQQRQAPNKSDGVEEVCVSRSSIYP